MNPMHVACPTCLGVVPIPEDGVEAAHVVTQLWEMHRAGMIGEPVIEDDVVLVEWTLLGQETYGKLTDDELPMLREPYPLHRNLEARVAELKKPSAISLMNMINEAAKHVLPSHHHKHSTNAPIEASQGDLERNRSRCRQMTWDRATGAWYQW